MHFTKMHGLGNDYLYVYGEVPSNIEELSTKLSERHFGAGSDGMIYISPSAVAYPIFATSSAVAATQLLPPSVLLR